MNHGKPKETLKGPGLIELLFLHYTSIDARIFGLGRSSDRIRFISYGNTLFLAQVHASAKNVMVHPAGQPRCIVRLHNYTTSRLDALIDRRCGLPEEDPNASKVAYEQHGRSRSHLAKGLLEEPYLRDANQARDAFHCIGS